MQTFTIVVSPNRRGTTYSATLESTGETLLTNVREPFLSAARALLRSGRAEPTDRLEMRHQGQPVALRGSIGKAAGLTVRETASQGPMFAPFREREAWA